MFTLKVTSFKAGFFDRAAVMGKVPAAARKALSKFGAFVRTRSRSSIRKRKRISAAGSPPSSHTGLLRKFIFFAYDAGRESVVIGPALLNSRAGDAPEALEYGGQSTITSTAFDHGRKVRSRRKVPIAARPFMRPAFEAELPGAESLWKDSIR